MEKTYYDFMNEISEEELYEKLVRYGFFTDKLPDFLETDSFWDFCKNKKHNFEVKAYDSIKFESIRNNFIPRILGIPTPMAHEILCKCIADNWSEIKNKFKENTKNEKYKVSRIHIRKMYGKNQLFEMNYNNYKIDGTPEIEVLIGKKFLVKTDISTCFPSIYTHSIGWALVGKDTAKQNMADESKWYNKLDLNARNERYGETHGLIIGPHTSNILAEIILTEVDRKMGELGYEYIRNIDDYSCYVKDENEAKRFIEDLSKVLREYDLFLNHKKTSIIKLPISVENEWVRKLNAFQFNDEIIKYTTVRAYFDMAIDLTEKFKDTAILKYAIKVINKKKLTKNAINYFIKTIFHYALIYQYLIPLLDEQVLSKYNIASDDVDKIVNQIYENGVENNNYEAIMYGIYYAIKYNIELKKIDVKKILTEENCLVPLLGYRYFKKDRENKKIIKEYAQKLNNSHDMDRNWIFVYEVLSLNELKNEWKALKRKKVTFIKNGY